MHICFFVVGPQPTVSHSYFLFIFFFRYSAIFVLDLASFACKLLPCVQLYWQLPFIFFFRFALHLSWTHLIIFYKVNYGLRRTCI